VRSAAVRLSSGDTRIFSSARVILLVRPGVLTRRCPRISLCNSLTPYVAIALVIPIQPLIEPILITTLLPKVCASIVPSPA